MITFHPVVWLCYAASLGLPLGIAVVGAEREKRVNLAAVRLPACGSVRELFAAAKGVAEEELGVRLVALYGPAGGELRVLAAAVEGHDWPPLAPGGRPADGVLQWVPMPDTVGFLGTFGEESTSGEGLARLAEAVSVQIDQLARTPST